MARRKAKPPELELTPALQQALESVIAAGPEGLVAMFQKLVEKVHDDPRWETLFVVAEPGSLPPEFLDVSGDLTLQSPPMPDVFYTVKITLIGSEPPITRTLEIPDMSFGDLNRVIQLAMGWSNSHMHEFRIGRSRVLGDCLADGGLFDLDQEDEFGVQVSQLTDKERGKVTFTYDFGDSWEHAVKISAAKPRKPGVEYPRCLAGARACPPEDCGGIFGYLNLCDTLQRPAHELSEDEKRQLEWLASFDPDEFSVDKVNALLKKAFAPPKPKASKKRPKTKKSQAE
ncbi:MAG: plasmid pRiA4b ORF-3 family protein [Planctomycetaceae bacterium]|nr:plasmid pRiA4b ORF-3 family protein [Planctomycetaceae bacterium]